MKTDLQDVRQLRKKTEAGMMDCLRALSESKGDLSGAEALLKEWGLAAAEKRSGRQTKEGRVFLHAEGRRAAMVELACETDFVALNASFIETGNRVAALACARGSNAPDAEMEGMVAALAGVMKENLALRRLAFLECGPEERLEAYLHGEGRIGVLLRVKADPVSALADERVAALVHDLALHVAAFGPSFVDEGTVPAEYRAERLASFRTEVEEDPAIRDKPLAIREGIIEGRMRKHLAAICLLGHGFVRDEKKTVASVLKEVGAAAGARLSVGAFACLRVETEAEAEAGSAEGGAEGNPARALAAASA